MSLTRVAVIGAGMAGMACAQRLAAQGVQVDVYEKSRGLGGRMSTRRGDNWQCDHGAQFFTARDPGFMQQVAQWAEAGIVAPWPARMAAYDKAGWRALDDATVRYVGLPGMNAPVTALAQQITVHRGTQVIAIRQTGTAWAVDCQGGKADTPGYQALALAMPAPQAHALASPWSAELAATAQAVTMLPSWALIGQFADAPFADFDAAFINHGPLRWLARQASKPGRPENHTWLIHANAAWSAAHLDATPEAVAATLFDALKQLGGKAPAEHLLHRWRYADIDQPLAMGSALDRDCRLGMCGDWLNGGKVEGAWLSGRHLADCLLTLG
ncbi:NAD(P)/FAD-dependent oxidoreductase [Chitinimonas sp.]|uniref:NAD(P)/FAD-dependent oxidoreductase n=1 Tax=Chitinimonas sp. TaxID=1934313 RepID=UPI0035B1D28B